ncbi:myoD family inhibitor-like isoform X2 [Carcharodon carcharias]|uniref:myoD family inhibitor-like isoform X2 n=1 Tax=Carcharodon carcharias TaxID=13397 RepID=UPI001B7F4402|nr:myoD family inhibitor-like isoform X2 [Carcharodon carcharias]
MTRAEMVTRQAASTPLPGMNSPPTRARASYPLREDRPWLHHKPALPAPVLGDAGSKRPPSLYANGGATPSGAQSCPGPLPPPICTSPGPRPEKARLGSASSVCTRSSYKSASSQLPPPVGEDCCIHCILACLFCELLVFCDLLLDCASCGAGGEAGAQASCCCCCCCCGSGEACRGSEETCPCNMECGVLEDCCGSSDCLEICLECCSICFPA